MVYIAVNQLYISVSYLNKIKYPFGCDLGLFAYRRLIGRVFKF